MIEIRNASYAALVLRLSLGTMFVAHALLKLLVFTLPAPPSFSSRSACPARSVTRSSLPNSSAACC